MAPLSNGRLPLLLLLALGGVPLTGGFEQEAVIVGVTASKYDTRSGLADDDFKGCFENGCGPELLIDGILNDVKQSRWSCETALVGSIFDCYATFDLGEAFTLTKLVLYFRESNDTSRTPNDFIISTSLTDVTYEEAFTGVNVLGTEIGVGEEFPFPNSTTGRYVRLTGDLPDDEWMSINEAELFVDSDDLIVTPTVAPTPAAIATASPTAGPTAGVTGVDGEECSTITLGGAGNLSGTYVSTATASASLEVTFVSSANNTTVMSQDETNATCTDSSSNCKAAMWKIAADSELKYVVYDDAEHPSLIEELWISLDDCSTGMCQTSPADLSVVCGDGTASLAPTPAPVAIDASVCGVLEVTGTKLNAIDGLYYDDGTGATSGDSKYSGFDSDGTSNGNMVLVKVVDGACSSPSSSSAATGVAATGVDSSDCAFRQWWVSASDSSTSASGEAEPSYFTYDEADHPADMVAGGLWYTSTDVVLPYAGEVVITCAPATTPTLSPVETGLDGSPVPSPTPTTDSRELPSGGENTRAPVLNETTIPGPGTGTAGESSDGGGSSSSTGAIVGGVVGGVALLAVLGAVAYKMKTATPPPPPPSYNDLVGGA